MSTILDSSGDGKTETTILELMDKKVNKYTPGIQTFKLVELTGLQPDSRKVETSVINIGFIQNKDLSPFQYSEVIVNRSAILLLHLPKEVTRKYKYAKYIPEKTRFLGSFPSSDLSKIKIVAGLFETSNIEHDETDITIEE